MSESTKSFLERWFITVLGVLLAASVVNGVRADSLVALLAASLLLGILNAFFRPFLLILALPLLVLTLGLFTFVINALLLYLVGNVIKGFHVDGFWPALKASVLISIVSFIASIAFGKKEVRARTGSPPRSSPPPNTGSGPVIDV